MTFDEWLCDYDGGFLAEDGPDIETKLKLRVAQDAWDAATKAAQPQWRPIETAPKNGWPFIASHAGGRPFECYRGPHGDLLDSKDRLRDPTAWTPMPLPPEKTE